MTEHERLEHQIGELRGQVATLREVIQLMLAADKHRGEALSLLLGAWGTDVPNN